jgi:hypothetical protein
VEFNEFMLVLDRHAREGRRYITLCYLNIWAVDVRVLALDSSAFKASNCTIVEGLNLVIATRNLPELLCSDDRTEL